MLQLLLVKTRNIENRATVINALEVSTITQSGDDDSVIEMRNGTRIEVPMAPVEFAALVERSASESLNGQFSGVVSQVMQMAGGLGINVLGLTETEH